MKAVNSARHVKRSSSHLSLMVSMGDFDWIPKSKEAVLPWIVP